MTQALNHKELHKILGGQKLLFLQAFEELPMGVMISDSKGNALYFNRAQLQMDEVTASEVINKMIVDAYGPASRGTSLLLYCLSSQRPVLNHWQVYKTPSGKVKRAVSSALPLFDADGKLAGCIAYTKEYQDSTPYEQYEQYRATEKELSLTESQFKSSRSIMKHLVGNDPQFINAIKVAKAAAAVTVPILIYGETGVGKELFAKAIHNLSDRAKKPFVAVNCSAIPESLFESLMFGVTRGAFTGALEKPGFFEEAQGGSLFLDELDSMPILLQAKILRVIQEKVFRRLGAERDQAADVRVISAMGREPGEAIATNRLRSDLYFRLGSLQVSIPPLRNRPGDLDLLTSHFIEKHVGILKKQIRQPSQDLLDLFRAYSWPGNVRELEHVITGAIIMASPRRQTLGADLLPEYFKNIVFNSKPYIGIKAEIGSNPNSATEISETPLPLPLATGSEEVLPPFSFVEREVEVKGERKTEPLLSHSLTSPKKDLSQLGGIYEKNMIEQSLTQSFGNVSLAARLLAISPQTLAYKIKKHGLNRHDYRLKDVESE